MRLAGIEKGGYYPYPATLYLKTASYLKAAPGRGRLLDPCAGEGLVGQALGKLLNCTTWGAELFPQRAEIAATRFDLLHPCAFQDTHLTNQSISFLWLNPPYDWDRLGTEKRLEVEFLKKTLPNLMYDGILAFNLPHHVLKYAASTLAGNFTELRAYQFPEPEYSLFKQIVVFGVRKPYSTPTKERLEILETWATTPLPELQDELTPLYQIPDAPKGNARFIFAYPEENYLINLTRKSGVLHSPAFQAALQPQEQQKMLAPAVPLKKGHLAMLMASGMMGTLRLKDQDGKHILIRGRVAKKIKYTKQPDPKDPETVIENYKDQFVTTITTLQTDGAMENIQDTKGLMDFMAQYGEQIATGTLATYKPLYDLHPTDQEMEILGKLGLGRKALPGHKPGLLPVQKHTVISAARSIKKYRTANIQGEMGIGKTTVGTATVELLHAYPAIVICPPHLVEKWIREITEITPGAYARELKKIGVENSHQVNDAKQFIEDYQQGKIPRKSIAVVASTSAKLASGWKPVVKSKTFRTPEGQKVLAYTCPVCGKPQLNDKGGLVTDAKYFQDQRRFCTNPVPGWVRGDDGETHWSKTRVCHTPLFEYTTDRRYSLAEYLNKHAVGFFKLLIADEVHEYKAATSDRSIAFHQLAVACRHHVLTLTGTFFGGKSTTIFWLLYRLNRAIRDAFRFKDEMKWIGKFGILESTSRRKVGDNEQAQDGFFTGNRRYAGRGEAHEVPGISPAIIQNLLHNTTFVNLKDLNVQLPEYREEVVTVHMQEEQELDYKRMEYSLRELARQQPRFLSVWLQWSLGRPNSAFREEEVVLHLKNLPPNLLADAAREIFTQADEDLKKGDTTLTKFATQLAKAAQLAEEALSKRGKVVDTDIPLMKLPAIKGLLPKEQWLIDYCKTEIQQRRRVIIYMRQTGTRDIQEHVETLLRNHGINAITLTGNINARRREEWIEKHSQYDVLICNPRLVQTGLDLVSFATIIFYEIEYSLYTLWQALRRVWRLGQTKPVKALFVVYQDSLEAKALALMGKKMRAAQLLYGDEVGGAIVEDETDDLLSELAKSVLDGAKLDDLKSLFSETAKVSHSPVGSLVEPSAPLLPVPAKPVVTNLMSWAEFALANKVEKKAGKAKAKAHVDPTKQFSLF